MAYFLVDTRLKLASNRQSRFFDLHREHGWVKVFRASQASLAWRQRVQLFARPAFRKSSEALGMSELSLFMELMDQLEYLKHSEGVVCCHILATACKPECTRDREYG